MATVTGLTAERMAEIEAASVVDGNVDNNGHLILRKFDASVIDAGSVIGPVGPAGGGLEICTSTTRPIYEPEEAGKGIYETNTNFVRFWNGTQFKLHDRVVCTHATRPALETWDAGTPMYETDTGYEYVWNGTTYVLFTGVAGVDLRRAAALSLPASTVTRIPMDTVYSDDDYGDFYNGANGTVVIPSGFGGLYTINATLKYPSANWISPSVSLRINGYAIARDEDKLGFANAYPIEMTFDISRTVRLDPGDVVDVVGYHESGGPANITIRTANGLEPNIPTLSVWRIGR